MGAHVHDPMQDEAIERWPAARMRKHLVEVHGLTTPMSWDIGRLHQAHLDDHQKGIGFAVPPTDPFGDDICGAFYGLGGGLATQCARPVNHPPVSVDGIGHSSQPIPIQPSAVPVCGAVSDDYPSELTCEYPAGHGPVHPNDDPDEDPMDHGAPSKGGWFNDPTKAEEAPMPTQPRPHEHGDIAVWHDVTPSQFVLEHVIHDHGMTLTPDESLYGRHAQAHPMPKTPVAALREAHTEHAEKQEDRRVTVDRIICTLAGLDFDRDWAADSGIGPNARGAVRKAYAEQAEKLLTWLERGGAMSLPGYASLGTDLESVQISLNESESLVHDLEEVNNVLRQQLQTALSLKDAAVEQLAIDQREHGKSLDAVQRQLEESEHRRQGLFTEMGELRARLEDERAVAMRRAQESEDAAEALRRQLALAEGQLRGAEDTLDDLRTELEVRVRERDEARQRNGELSTQLSLLSEDLEQISQQRDNVQDQLAGAGRAYVAMKARRDEALQVLGETAAERDRALQALSDKLTEAGQLREEVEALRRVSTVTEASQAPVHGFFQGRPELGREDAKRAAERQEQLDAIAANRRFFQAEDDNVSWARRFAAGEL